MSWSAAIQATVAVTLATAAAIAAVSVRFCDQGGCHWQPLLGGGAIVVGVIAIAAAASTVARRRERRLVGLLGTAAVLAVFWVLAFVLSLAYYGT